tara:strand:- start:3165 stop:4313 length:1149 start_codon:yes stop_codon:yes gene_type:complete
MNILIIGADGYMGWPLACQLFLDDSVKNITLVDNLITRRKVNNVGSNSLTPISSFNKRSKVFSEIHKNKARFIRGSVTNYKFINELVSNKYDVIYHLGHLRTAPYSMMSHKTCLETISNNEIGFLNIIWSLKERSKNTLLIKLGSFGAYAPVDGKIPEGDLTLGKSLTPFPKDANDFYHITKANDSLFARAACRNWNLKIIDVMQSTVFGVETESTKQINEFTRFDYDEIYGTVLNRFILQASANLPLTIYGGGKQSSGIMVLRDAINVLNKLKDFDIHSGSYQVINNNPKSYKILDLAQKVKNAFDARGKDTVFNTTDFDPRNESKNNSNISTTAECDFMEKNISVTNIDNEITNVIDVIDPFISNRIIHSVINPTLEWNK